MVLDWPEDLLPSTATFWLEANTSRTESPLNRSSQVLVRQGARFRCDLTFDMRDWRTAGRLDALLAQLDGSAGEIRLWDFRRPVPRGEARDLNPVNTLFTDNTAFTDRRPFFDGYGGGLFPRVTASADRGADTLATGGWAPLEHVFLAGDYLGVSGRVYLVTADVVADTGANAIVPIRPRLRSAVVAGTTISVVRPTTRFRLADNGQGANRTSPGFISSYNISFLESLP